MAGPRFAPTEIAPTSLNPLFSPAFNTAVRTNKKNEVVVLMFEAGITYPTKGGVPLKAGVSGALKGYRVVGHIGFLSGSSGGAGKAEEAFRGVDGVTLDAELERAVRVGSVLADERLGVTGDGPWPVFDGAGRILAVYERRGPGRVKPAVVLV